MLTGPAHGQRQVSLGGLFMIAARKRNLPRPSAAGPAAHSPPAKSIPALRLLLASITRGEQQIADRPQPKEPASRQAEFGLD